MGETVRQCARGTVVLIPAYKPSGELPHLCAALVEAGHAVVVVDDGSSPQYEPVFAGLPGDVIVLRHDTNRGKGAALKTGLQYIYDRLLEHRTVVTADADGQHRIEDIVKVGGYWRMTEPSLVLGSRHLASGAPKRSRFGNALTRRVFAASTGVKVHDTQTGLRAFGVSIIPDLLGVAGEHYEYELNVLLWAAKRKVAIFEVPVQTVYIDKNSSSHFRPIIDSLRVYSCLFKFTLSSFAAFVIDFALLLLFTSLTTSMSAGTALLVSVVAARFCSCLCNFLINRRLVFDKTSHLLARAVGYYALAVFILGANYSLLYVGTIVAGLQLWIAKILTEATLFGFSYSMQKRLVFR